MTDEERQLSADAKQLLESAACKRVLAVSLDAYRRALEHSQWDQREFREHCYRMIEATKEFHRHLTVLANKGKLDNVRQKTRGGDRSAV